MNSKDNQENQTQNSSYFTQRLCMKDNSISFPNKHIKDPILGFITFPRSVWYIVDSPLFQRLKNIKQLVGIQHTVNGTSFSAFETSLGVGFLAQEYITQILKNHKEDYTKLGFQSKSQFDRIRILTIIAGLCYNVGILPYHCILKKVILKYNSKIDEKERFVYCEKNQSCLVLKKIIKQYHKKIKYQDLCEKQELENLKRVQPLSIIYDSEEHQYLRKTFRDLNMTLCCQKQDKQCQFYEKFCKNRYDKNITNDLNYLPMNFSDEEIGVVEDMIKGMTNQEWNKKYSEKETKYPFWIFKIVCNNEKQDFDIQKLYLTLITSKYVLQRENLVDFKQIFCSTSIVNNDIIIEEKLTEMENLKHEQSYIYRTSIQNQEVAGINFVYEDAFFEAFEYLNLKQKLQNWESFLHLDDFIVQDILRLTPKNVDDKIIKSQNLLKRLQNSDYFQIIASNIILNSNFNTKELKKKIKEEISHQVINMQNYKIQISHIERNFLEYVPRIIEVEGNKQESVQIQKTKNQSGEIQTNNLHVNVYQKSHDISKESIASREAISRVINIPNFQLYEKELYQPNSFQTYFSQHTPKSSVDQQNQTGQIRIENFKKADDNQDFSTSNIATIQMN